MVQYRIVRMPTFFQNLPLGSPADFDERLIPCSSWTCGTGEVIHRRLCNSSRIDAKKFERYSRYCTVRYFARRKIMIFCMQVHAQGTRLHSVRYFATPCCSKLAACRRMRNRGRSSRLQSPPMPTPTPTPTPTPPTSAVAVAAHFPHEMELVHQLNDASLVRAACVYRARLLPPAHPDTAWLVFSLDDAC